MRDHDLRAALKATAKNLILLEVGSRLQGDGRMKTTTKTVACVAISDLLDEIEAGCGVDARDEFHYFFFNRYLNHARGLGQDNLGSILVEANEGFLEAMRRVGLDGQASVDFVENLLGRKDGLRFYIAC